MTEIAARPVAITLAIDPGQSGALAWVDADGTLIDVADMPIVEVRGKKRVSASLLAILMNRHPVVRVVIEGVGAMPKQGVASSFTFGYSAGMIEGVAAGHGSAVEIVMSAVWKRRASVPSDKGAARLMAQRAWPAHAALFARVKDDGRAEAALLGRWAALGGSVDRAAA